MTKALVTLLVYMTVNLSYGGLSLADSGDCSEDPRTCFDGFQAEQRWHFSYHDALMGIKVTESYSTRESCQNDQSAGEWSVERAQPVNNGDSDRDSDRDKWKVRSFRAETYVDPDSGVVYAKVTVRRFGPGSLKRAIRFMDKERDWAAGGWKDKRSVSFKCKSKSHKEKHWSRWFECQSPNT